MTARTTALNFAARFWSKVDVRGLDECWPWLGGKYSNPSHPKLQYGQARDQSGRKVRAHRLAHELTRGPIPRGMQVCHRCDNPPCCNPVHLFAGTMKENMEDRDRKGRGWRPRMPGASNPASKLTADDVIAIRALVQGGLKCRIVAERFHVAYSTVYGIVRGRRWAA